MNAQSIFERFVPAFALAAVLLTCVGSRAAAPKADGAQLYQQAAAAYQKRDYARALQLFTESFDARPARVAALMVASCYAQIHNQESQTQTAKQIIHWLDTAGAANLGPPLTPQQMQNVAQMRSDANRALRPRIVQGGMSGSARGANNSPPTIKVTAKCEAYID